MESDGDGVSTPPPRDGMARRHIREVFEGLDLARVSPLAKHPDSNVSDIQAVIACPITMEGIRKRQKFTNISKSWAHDGIARRRQKKLKRFQP